MDAQGRWLVRAKGEWPHCAAHPLRSSGTSWSARLASSASSARPISPPRG